MRILDRSVYVGPSLYARFPVIRLDLDLGVLEQWPTGRLGAAFVDAVAAALPGLASHGCSYREPGGFFRRMREDEGTWLGHVLEHVAIELQNIAGEEVTFGKTRGTGQAGVYTVVYEYAQRDEGIAAGDLGLRLLCSLLPAEIRPPDSVPGGWNWDEARDEFIRFAQRRALGPSTAALVRAAENQDIPWLRLNDQSLVQLGHGKYQQRIQATVTSRTSHIAVELASDKEETNKILATLGLPVPRQELVQNEGQAVRAARRIGFPVVTKPYNGNHGRGISIRLTTDEEVVLGFTAAREHSRSVIVETFLEGDDHRLLVVNGELVAATRRTPGHVVGDGVHSIAQLTDIVNQDPRRGVGHEKVLTRLELDAQARKMLGRAGLEPRSVPETGRIVYLRSTANLSTGGTATDVTDVIHPDNREMAERAVRAIGLDVGGVDFLSKNITESYRTIGGGICEVNAAPGFRMHVAPSEGTPRDVAAPVVGMLFPPGAAARVPIAAITGTNGKTTTARMLAHVTKMGGYTPGLTTTDGVYIDGQRTVQGDMTGPVSARMVLADPQIDIAILETARGGLLRAGMGVREVDVGAVLNVQADHLGLKGIDTLEQLAELKRIVVEVATGCAVLNADDALVLKMSGYTEAKHICYVTMNPQHSLVREHIRAGGRACALEAGVNGHMMTLYDRGGHIPLLWTHLIPATLEGRATHNVQNAMFAAAMAFSLGIKLDAIRQGLRTFDSTFYQAPGRLARLVMRDRRIEAAVLETARGGILRRGLAMTQADVAVVTNISADHFGEYGIDDLDALAEAKLTVAAVVRPAGLLILNADDSRLRTQANGILARFGRCPPLGWFALDADQLLLRDYRARGASTCGVRAGRLCLHYRGSEHDLGPVSAMPLSMLGVAAYNVANLAAAGLAAIALGIEAGTISRVFARFGSTLTDNPGRMMRFEMGGATVLIDYAHNPEGLRGLLRVADLLRRGKGRLGLLLGQAGNRKDADIEEVARAAAEFVPDLIVVKENETQLRGREPGDVPRILRAELLRLGLPAAALPVKGGEVDAARCALDWARPGDVLALPLHSAAARRAVQAEIELRGANPGVAAP